jgi:hypothetical protein
MKAQSYFQIIITLAKTSVNSIINERRAEQKSAFRQAKALCYGTLQIGKFVKTHSHFGAFGLFFVFKENESLTPFLFKNSFHPL